MSDDMGVAKPEALLSDEALDPDTREFLTFRLDGEEYAVPIEKVTEIRAWEAVTRVPNSEAWECGLINIRGAIVPIIDMRLRLGIAPKAYTKHTVVVLFTLVDAQGRERTRGVVVDELSDVMRFPESRIQPPPQLSPKPSLRFAQGVVEHQDRMIVMLNISEALLHRREEAA